jgi:hypothetical protein
LHLTLECRELKMPVAGVPSPPAPTETEALQPMSKSYNGRVTRNHDDYDLDR